jgi:FixJ family two-component response regulator
LVLIVDDDPSMRDSLAALFRSIGLDAEVFDSIAALLQRKLPMVESCIVLDVRMPGVGGLEFLSAKQSPYGEVPVVLVTGLGDIPMSVHAMKAGAIDFLTKPFREQDILDAVSRALARDRDVEARCRVLLHFTLALPS